MASVRAAVAITSISQYVIILLSFVKVIVVSRYLLPSEVGVYAIAMPLLLFIRTFRVFGTLDYIVAQDKVTESDLRICYTINVCISVFIAVILYFGADYVALFFEANSLTPVLQLMSFATIIFPLAVIPQALFQRNMDFASIAKIQVVSTLAETVVALSMVVAGYGVISLAWGVVAASASAILVIFIIEREFLFLRLKIKGGYDIIRFGTVTWLSTTLNQFSDLFPAMLLGKTLGVSQLGFFSRGQTPVTIFRQAIDVSTGKVAQSWFAQISRADSSQLSRVYLKIMRLTSGLAWPFAIMLVFHADSLIPILLGNQWAESIPVAQILAVSLMFAPYTFYGTKLLLARGQVGRQLKFEIVAQILRLVLLVGAVTYGIDAFAIAIALSSIVSMFLISIVLKKSINLGFFDVLKCLTSSMILALSVAFPNIIFYQFIMPETTLSIFVLIIILGVNGLFWVGALFFTKHDLWLEIGNIWRKVISSYTEHKKPLS
jgi:O-antigen/teichoic acid export membrane protein